MSRPHLIVVPQHDHVVVWDGFAGEYLRFDGDAARVLLDLARHASTSDIDERCAAIIEDFAARGFIGFDGRLRARLVEVTPHAGRATAPLLVHVEVNAVCNLACTHCFAAPLPRADEPLSLAELDDLFAQMAALGSMRVSLTGGEPLMRKDILDVARAASSRGLSVALTTNGLLVDDTVARGLRDADLRWLNVSLEGASPATNDLVRGDGVFDRVIAKLAVLRRHDVPFALAFTLMRHNVDEVDACVALAERTGARTAVFRPLYPVGAAAHRPDLMPAVNDVRRAFARVHALAAGGSACGVVDGPSGCGAGRSICSFDVAGRSSPCGFLGERFHGPSLRDASLAEIWASPMFASMRGGDAGGCRARALAATGSAFARDPWLDEGRKAPRALPIVGDVDGAP